MTVVDEHNHIKTVPFSEYEQEKARVNAARKKMVSILDEHEVPPEPQPDPMPNCYLPACTYWMCISDCYGTRRVQVHCSEGEIMCWVDDPCMGLCWETPRIPELCKPCCKTAVTCASSSCCCPSGSCQCGAAVKGAGCGCEKQVPTVAPAPTTSIMARPQPYCVGGQCYQHQPQQTATYRRFGGGHSPQYLQGDRNVQIQQKVVQLGIGNRVGVRTDASDDDDNDRSIGGRPIRNIIEKIRNRPSPGPER